MREAEVADLKRQFDEASAKATAGFTNPLQSAQTEVEKAFGTEPSAADTSSTSLNNRSRRHRTVGNGALAASAMPSVVA